MKWTMEDFEKHFCCPKCHNHGALVQEVQLGRTVARLVPLIPARYWAVSCGLCGYTEFYQLAILQKAAQPAVQAAPLAEKTESSESPA